MAVVANAISYLYEHIRDPDFTSMKENAFFSGSLKGFTSVPMFYPQNFDQFLNGSIIHNLTYHDLLEGDLMVSVSGYVLPALYDVYLEEKWTGFDTPTTFPGFNQPPSEYFLFPYWSSPPLTDAMALLAFTKYASLTA